MGPLVIGPNGAFYGTSECEGLYSCGMVFELSANLATITDLHDFTGAPSDGSSPASGVIVLPNGAIYGTTSGGGSVGRGTVWEINASGTYSVLHSFTGTNAGDAQDSDGDTPVGGLCLASDGNLYGTTFGGRSSDHNRLY